MRVNCRPTGHRFNAYFAGRFGEAASEYILAARFFSDLQLSSTALAEVQKAQDVVGRGPDALNNAVAALASYATRIQAGTGPAGMKALRTLFDSVLKSVAAAGHINPELAVILWNTIKGNAFSAALQEPPAWRCSPTVTSAATPFISTTVKLLAAVAIAISDPTAAHRDRSGVSRIAASERALGAEDATCGKERPL